MITIYINYIADYIERRTRANAFHRLMNEIQENMPALSSDEAIDLMTKANSFSTEYSNAWPWERARVVANALRIE